MVPIIGYIAIFGNVHHSFPTDAVQDQLYRKDILSKATSCFVDSLGVGTVGRETMCLNVHILTVHPMLLTGKKQFDNTHYPPPLPNVLDVPTPEEDRPVAKWSPGPNRPVNMQHNLTKANNSF